MRLLWMVVLCGIAPPALAGLHHEANTRWTANDVLEDGTEIAITLSIDDAIATQLRQVATLPDGTVISIAFEAALGRDVFRVKKAGVTAECWFTGHYAGWYCPIWRWDFGGMTRVIGPIDVKSAELL